jgi:hypothetical protein
VGGIVVAVGVGLEVTLVAVGVELGGTVVAVGVEPPLVGVDVGATPVAVRVGVGATFVAVDEEVELVVNDHQFEVAALAYVLPHVLVARACQ